MIYLDSAAVVKLVVAEPESPALVDWLNVRDALPRFTSTLAEVEVTRAIRRAAPEALGRVPRVLDRMYRLEIDAHVRAVAAAFDDPLLRSPDAIHLATALRLSDENDTRMEAFVTYDKRLLEAARRADLPTAAPGPHSAAGS
ncbi:putative nucleic acid-binding protein, contains PIN domain [Frankia torreyi]|uniref:Ribonuclease VapC n=1 Tax=Frankia torreyi TaxID=1856 RepID=A0A0D8B811_9ACTN|nr:MULTISPECIES: type II toxin-antitoxin system VapC family toxin [Frankia]KJE19527.1 putative nucleic acid-binding protein, contains PIN domain [Frankia torreyi]KQC37849.1 ribonuclease [Frankia sp. ACN1ag]KQM01966.1 putative nucleic acid-binding protein, contains PIN domain [Frankia sp. CpI1-P]